MRKIWLLVSALLGLSLLLSAGCEAPPLVATTYRIRLIADGQEQQIETEAATVRALLAEAEVTIGELDRVTPPEISAITEGMTIAVVRVAQETMVITQTVPFERQTMRDSTIPTGESRLLQSGQAGQLERHYRITFENGQESERILVRETMVQPPRDEIRLTGARPQLHNVPITGTLAYLSNHDAWVMRGSSFQRQRLTYVGDLDGRVFSLSPDGRQLLFTRASTSTEQLNSLWLVPTTVAAPDAVPLSVPDLLWADWAPDGQTIAWSTAETTEQTPGWRGNNDLWYARLIDGSTLAARRRILEPTPGGGYGWWGTRFLWSPAGTHLAYSQPESVGVVELATASRSALLRFPAFRSYSSWAWNPAMTWSPDGAFLATVAHGDDGAADPEESPIFNLVALESSGAYSATLAVETGMWAAPQYAPDGQSVLFGRAIIPYQSANSRYTLHLIDRDGSGQRPLYRAEGDSGLEIPIWVWAPDGKAIAFIEMGDVRVLDVDTAGLDILTAEGGVTLVVWR